MEIVKPGMQIDFMGPRRFIIGASLFAMIATVVLLFVPGPNYGIDFRGGTELQVKFGGAVSAAELRGALTSLGYKRPDVVNVAGRQNEYIIRVAETSSVPAGLVERMKRAIHDRITSSGLRQLKVSPGGDKISFQFTDDIEQADLQAAMLAVGARVRSIGPFGRPSDHRFEAQLIGVGDQVVDGLKTKLGRRAPDAPLRVEWVGPKAGQQLRDAAIKALLYAIAFIMIYVAFRFDLRFAPGGVIALLHDAFFTVGVLVLLQKEVNLTTVAALLTIVGYSINDTIVVYDRIRENMQRLRQKTLYELINISTSQTLSRTILTSATTLISISAFFIWGTPVIRDFALALFVGILVGTYSSIYIAAPVTEWMDKRFFRRAA